MNMDQPLDATRRMEEQDQQRRLNEFVADAKVMVIAHWRTPEKKLPPKPEKYVVMVEEGGMAYLTTRSWSGTDWLNMRPCEAVTEWLDGLLLPTDLRLRDIESSADRTNAS